MSAPERKKRVSPGIALASRAPSQLVVDAARLVALRTDDVEPAEVEHLLVVGLPLFAGFVHAPFELGLELVGSFLEPLGDQLRADLVLLVAAEDDVDTAAGHVRRDRDGALTTRLSDDLRLALVLLCVEDVVRDAAARQELREILGGLDGDRPYEHRLAGLVALGDLVERGVELRLHGAVDEVVVVLPRHRHVGGDLRDVEPVDLAELLLLRLRRTGHPGQLVVEPEVVLERDRRHRDVLLLDAHVLLRLDGLVEALGPAPAFHDATGELVDDLHLAVLDHVLLVTVVQRLRFQRL